MLIHSDFNPFSILLRGDKVDGLVDGGCSEWYAAYGCTLARDL